MILKQVDHLTKWIMNKYSISYYKKYKKDPPILGFISKIQYKIFSKVMRITPRGKKKIIVSAVSIWAVWFVFGRTDGSFQSDEANNNSGLFPIELSF